jgi:hypothetical protein|eukprot:COSAG03_NODE_370_length_8522_cov_167.915232_1_plen_100_part_00
MDCFSGNQVAGATVFSMCTRVASKIAPHSSCSGIDTASSASVMAGYLLRATIRRFQQPKQYRIPIQSWSVAKGTTIRRGQQPETVQNFNTKLVSGPGND